MSSINLLLVSLNVTLALSTLGLLVFMAVSQVRARRTDPYASAPYVGLFTVLCLGTAAFTGVTIMVTAW